MGQIVDCCCGHRDKPEDASSKRVNQPIAISPIDRDTQRNRMSSSILDRFDLLRLSLPFSHMHIKSFLKAVRDIGRERFTVEDLERRMIKEIEVEEERQWQRNRLLLFLQSLPSSKGNYVTRKDIECLALLWCQGTVREKAEQLYLILNPCFNEDGIRTAKMSPDEAQSNRNVFRTILLIATKQIVEFSFRNDPDGLEKELFDPKLHMRAIKAMQAYDWDDYDPEETEDNRQEKMGGLMRIFDPEIIILRGEFYQILESDNCNWIFDDHRIRQRMRESFMDEYVLETIGF